MSKEDKGITKAAVRMGDIITFDNRPSSRPGVIIIIIIPWVMTKYQTHTTPIFDTS